MTIDGYDCRLAVLIDGENVRATAADGLFRKIAGLGKARVRRIYGNFSSGRLAAWQAALSGHSITPRQHGSCARSGKNAADIALAIDAMDLLHGGRLDGFCLVSSDSDFTPLAARLREQGADVYGFGERKTPESFCHACDRFFFLESLVPDAAVARLVLPAKDSIDPLSRAFASAQNANGWAPLGGVGTQLRQLAPDFDPRHFGHARLAKLVTATDAFEVRKDGLKVFIRPKPAAAAPRRASAG